MISILYSTRFRRLSRRGRDEARAGRPPAITLCVVAAGPLFGACVPVIETQDGRRLRATSDEFSEYSAAVFRRQNAASTALVEMLDRVEGIDPRLARRIEDADTKLQSACETLNAASGARRDGRDLPRSALRALVDDIPRCDAATQEAEALLDSVVPGSP